MIIIHRFNFQIKFHNFNCNYNNVNNVKSYNVFPLIYNYYSLIKLLL